MAVRKQKDQRRTHIVKTRLSNEELQVLDIMVKERDSSRSEVLRESLLGWRVICDKRISFADAIKPIPELAARLGIDLGD